MRKFTLLLILLIFPSVMQAQHYDHLSQIRLLLISEKFEDVLNVTDSLVLLDNMKAELYYFRGNAFGQLSRYDSAIHCFHQALKRDSSNLFYKIALGRHIIVSEGSEMPSSFLKRLSGRIRWISSPTWILQPCT